MCLKITGNHLDYVNTLDAIIEFFTNASVAVIMDMHWVSQLMMERSWRCCVCAQRAQEVN